MSTPTKLQVLLSKNRYLTLELQQVKAQHDEYLAEFIKHVKNMEQQHEMKFLKETEKKVQKSSKDSQTDRILKTLYHKIAVKAHPDKTNGDEDKTALYRQATRAHERSQTLELLDVCDQLDITIPNLPAKYYTQIEKSLNQLESEIQQLKRADCYLWGMADDQGKKKLEEHIIQATKQNK